MPLLEITQSRQISASVRLDEATATQVDQYAAFIKASADDVVDKALNYVFAKDRDFQDFLKTPEAKQISSTLRVRKAPSTEVVEQPAKKPNGKADAGWSPRNCAGGEGMIRHSIPGRDGNGASHRMNVTLHPSKGRAAVPHGFVKQRQRTQTLTGTVYSPEDRRIHANT